ncbi:MAG TPA: AraC family transcriptional regulator [Dongiaceae bacterium]|jgi:AraC family transcriptional regulator|nr:AraC family transcriptional regulator [Dongiaceae bacterium]
MAKAKQWIDYEERLDRVIHWIFDHLEEELDLNRLADIASLSPTHWHRIYQAMRGETIAATIKRLRLDRAATYLVQTSLSVEEIAKKSGYGDLSSFTRIFKSVYGLPPAQYRRQGSHTAFHTDIKERGKIMYNIAIKKLPSMQTITISHIGPYMEINRAYERLFGWLAARNAIPDDLRMIAIFYDDVALVPAEQLRSRAGIVTAKNIPIEAPLEKTEIAGGDYAILRHKGPYADMKAAYEWLYGQWLPQSGREPADQPGLEEYLNNPQDTKPTELLSDIYLPLRLKD